MNDQKYLESLIQNKVEENLNLDYKASGSLAMNDTKTKEISKDVSAFANSDGGTIIYGIKEDSLNRHLPTAIDPINRETITKEWLEQIIQGRIRPRINGILIHPIEIENDPKKVVYIVEIPKSTTAHQADDKKYYKRFNFNSEPMYDYEIKDIMNRVKSPIIDLEFIIFKKIHEIKPAFPTTLNYDMQIPKPEYQTDFYLKVSARNNGIVLALYINCYFVIASTCIIQKNNHKTENGIIEYSADNTVRDVVDMQISGMHPAPKYGPSRYNPILPRTSMKLDVEIPKLHQSCFDPENEISWVVYADNAEPQIGKIRFQDIKIIDK